MSLENKIELSNDGLLPRAPWTDYSGNELFAGDYIKHPDGTIGKIIYICAGLESIHDQWFVDYGDNCKLRLSLQIGDKGQAVKINSNNLGK